MTRKDEENEPETQDYLEIFLSAKRIEGCSEKTLTYYRNTIHQMMESVGKTVCTIETEDLRTYLSRYQAEKESSKVTIDNIRRIFSSFFAWLEDEDYIIKSPVRRIHRIKSASVIKETYTDEQLETMRDNCDNLRDLALIDILASTGMRVGELVLLNRDDISFEEREAPAYDEEAVKEAQKKTPFKNRQCLLTPVVRDLESCRSNEQKHQSLKDHLQLQIQYQNFRTGRYRLNWLQSVHHILTMQSF